MIAIFPEIANCAAEGHVEQLGVLVRRYFGGDETYAPQPDVAAMLRRAGLEVQQLSLDCQGSLLAKDESGAFRIVAVTHQGIEPVAERFMLAHMMGHFLLDIQPLIARGDWQVSGYRELTCPLKRYGSGTGGAQEPSSRQKERRADDFAAALLLPKGMIKKAAAKMEDAGQIAEFFGVTSACVERRLEQMGASGHGPANFLDAEERIGTAGKPAAETPPEPPKAASTTAAPADAPKPSATMPRSFAASNYGKTHQATSGGGDGGSEAAQQPGETPTAQPEVSPEAPAQTSPESAKGAPRKGGGMERIRELAKRIDKSVD